MEIQTTDATLSNAAISPGARQSKHNAGIETVKTEDKTFEERRSVDLDDFDEFVSDDVRSVQIVVVAHLS